jgi:multiple sugar transport system ATP-binding protein
VLGLRPEHLRLKSGKGATDVHFSGSIELVEPLGSDSFLDVDLGKCVVTVKEEGHFRAKVGESLQVYLDLDQMHIFEAESGDRINP